MEYMKNIKCKLECFVCHLLEEKDMQSLDAHELGEVIDMIKDMSEAIYYCTVVHAMENDNGQHTISHNSNPIYNPNTPIQVNGTID